PALLSALAESLPRTAPARALAFRAGYGALPLPLKSRYPASRVLAQERDLLDAAFLRRNARNLGLPIEVRETLFPADGLQPGSFSLVVGELSSPAGPAVAARELQGGAGLLAAGGEALTVAAEKRERDGCPAAAPERAALTLRVRGRGACGRRC